ncbi:hypothetical protein GA0070606_4308 [Micromonospora citrea]|uniref:Uncharacterized protein n=1 Tax=Micromonospora citrea TaxID=47855 RepID=A0A1C6VKC3_9ACTN|nr:hypothetical protein [Micromonospora citrea]SCL66360.1 hypothetical protein GA0070606_4308 [Micromonospora citrea]
MSEDEDRIVGLLRGLDVDPGRPTRVDLAGAVREARRRRRSRRTMSASAAGLAVVAAAAVPLLPGGGPQADRPVTVWPAAPSAAGRPSPVAAGPTACVVEHLTVPSGHARSMVTGGDPTGRFLVGRSYPVDDRGALVIIWDGGQAREYRLPGAEQRLVDVSPTGLAVGSTYVDNRPQPWIVRDGRPAPLSGVREGEATAVSEDGRVVGARLVDDRQLPVLWPSPDTPPVELPLPGSGWAGTAVGVDSDGTVVGKLQDGPHGGFRAVVWRAGGGPEVLPLPEVEGGTATEFVPHTFQGGWITGTAIRAVSGARYDQPARYHLPTGRYESLPWPTTPSLRPTPSDGGAAPGGVAPPPLAGNGPVADVPPPGSPGDGAPGPSSDASTTPSPSAGNAGGPAWHGFVTNAGNGRGWVVGATRERRAGLLTDARLVSLPGRDEDPGRDGALAVTVSDDGRVIGGQLHADQNGRGTTTTAVRWRCR